MPPSRENLRRRRLGEYPRSNDWRYLLKEYMMKTIKILVLALTLAAFAAGSLLGAGVKTAPASSTAGAAKK
jgi:hypothetical protein